MYIKSIKEKWGYNLLHGISKKTPFRGLENSSFEDRIQPFINNDIQKYILSSFLFKFDEIELQYKFLWDPVGVIIQSGKILDCANSDLGFGDSYKVKQKSTNDIETIINNFDNEHNEFLISNYQISGIYIASNHPYAFQLNEIIQVAQKYNLKLYKLTNNALVECEI